MNIFYTIKNKNLLSEINTSDFIYSIKNRMDNTPYVTFNPFLPTLLDHVFISNNINFLSIDQKRFILKFFDEADNINKNIDNEDLYDKIDDIIIQFDNFLGSYIGDINNGEFD